MDEYYTSKDSSDGTSSSISDQIPQKIRKCAKNIYFSNDITSYVCLTTAGDTTSPYQRQQLLIGSLAKEDLFLPQED
ncbi:hypothetical protein OUZ56_009696 [Daphnia magna]|uniref:Uncharacterized protein n=1 Tax=Daphnia magna TaxID=35525 RepID=A0ABR0AH66_9CRUS|nr:hypothetical protein OUZ56_009696 [Daphnia magna]